MSKADYIDLAIELIQHPEAFIFRGIVNSAYAEIKATEDPQYATPIDILIERFSRHGMKVVLGKNPQSGNVFILPGDSTGIEMDSLFPRHLQIHDDMDPKLKKLILANRKGFS